VFLSSKQIRIGDIRRFFTLYSVLVLYSAAYEHFYADQLVPLIKNDFIDYDLAKSGVYTLLNFLTPLAILPIGTRLRAPGQFIAGALTVLLFIPIPIVFVPVVTTSAFWGIYALLWVGYFSICILSSISINFPLPVVSETRFRKMLIVVYALFGIGFVYVIFTNRLALVAFTESHAARDEVTVFGIQGYLLVSYITSFGGLLFAMAIMLRKYFVIPLAIAGYIVCYAALAERNALLMPAWIVYIYFAHKLFFRDSVAKYLFTVMAPFLCGMLFVDVVGTENKGSILYFAFTLANYRLYSVPPLAFNVYYNFFETHPLTYWSHINIIQYFVSYPYGKPLSLVMDEAYGLGNYNASFIATDALAAAGTGALAFVSLVFGLILAGLNSCMRKLNLAVLAIVTAGPSIALMDTGIGPGLLTNGLALLALFLLFAPRSASWNLRYIDQRLR